MRFSSFLLKDNLYYYSMFVWWWKCFSKEGKTDYVGKIGNYFKSLFLSKWDGTGSQCTDRWSWEQVGLSAVTRGWQWIRQRRDGLVNLGVRPWGNSQSFYFLTEIKRKAVILWNCGLRFGECKPTTEMWTGRPHWRPTGRESREHDCFPPDVLVVECKCGAGRVGFNQE